MLDKADVLAEHGTVIKNIIESLDLPDSSLDLIATLLSSDVCLNNSVVGAIRNYEEAYMLRHSVLANLKLKSMTDPEFGDQLAAAWAEVANAIHNRAVKMRPKPASFNVLLEMEVSKEAFLVAVHKTNDIEKAKSIGINRGLPLDLSDFQLDGISHQHSM